MCFSILKNGIILTRIHTHSMHLLASQLRIVGEYMNAKKESVKRRPSDVVTLKYYSSAN